METDHVKNLYSIRFGVNAIDPATFAVGAALFLSVALVACLVLPSAPPVWTRCERSATHRQQLFCCAALHSLPPVHDVESILSALLEHLEPLVDELGELDEVAVRVEDRDADEKTRILRRVE